MTTTKKPTKLPPCVPAPSPDAPPFDLTPAEMSLLKAHRMMDDRAKRETLEDAECLAMRWPRRAAPSLRLVERTKE